MYHLPLEKKENGKSKNAINLRNFGIGIPVFKP